MHELKRNLVAALALPPLLAACGASSVATGPVHSAPPVAAEPGLTLPPRAPIRNAPRTAVVHMMPGLERVIGATPAELSRQFGAPRLDVWEGDARKLQFTGDACVLDVYLYPKARGAEPQATYVEARRPSEGTAIDRAACVTALRPAEAAPPAPAAPPAATGARKRSRQ